MKPDARDVVGLTGFALLASGVAMIDIPSALIVTGAILLGVVLAGAWRASGRRPRQGQQG